MNEEMDRSRRESEAVLPDHLETLPFAASGKAYATSVSSRGDASVSLLTLPVFPHWPSENAARHRLSGLVANLERQQRIELLLWGLRNLISPEPPPAADVAIVAGTEPESLTAA